MYLLYTGISKEYKVFLLYSDKLATVLPIHNMLSKLIRSEIITFSDSEVIDGLPKSQSKALLVLNLVEKSLLVNKNDYFY